MQIFNGEKHFFPHKRPYFVYKMNVYAVLIRN